MNNKFFKNSGCDYFQALIHKRLDGDITPEQNNELYDHLADCPDCLDELTSFAVVQELIDETIENPVEVPDGFFENLAAQLYALKPAHGIAGLLAHPFFSAYKNLALAATSVFLVAALTLGVGSGLFNQDKGKSIERMSDVHSRALILTNSGEAMSLPGDAGDTDHYSKALDDLERAYRESMGENTGEASEGYIHTSWSGGESAAPIR